MGHHFFHVALGASNAVHRRLVVIAEAPENRIRQLLQPRRVAQDLPPGGQVLVFVLGWIDRGDFGELEGYGVEAVATVRPRRLERREMISRVPPLAITRADLGEQNVVTAGIIDQPALHVRVRESVLLVLTVDREKQRRELLKGVGGDRDIVDPATAAPRRRDLAPDDQLRIVGSADFIEDRLDSGTDLESKPAFDPQALVARPDELRGGSSPGEEFEGGHQQRFSRARLPGEGDKPRRQLNLDGIDDAESLDDETLEHWSACYHRSSTMNVRDHATSSRMEASIMSHPTSAVVRNFAAVKSAVVDRARGATIQTLIGPADGAPNFITRRFTLAAGGRIPRHRHATIEHEQVILSGSMVIGLDDRETVVTEGDSIFIPAGVAHWYENRTDEPVSFICVIPHTPDYQTEWLEGPVE